MHLIQHKNLMSLQYTVSKKIIKNLKGIPEFGFIGEKKINKLV